MAEPGSRPSLIPSQGSRHHRRHGHGHHGPLKNHTANVVASGAALSEPTALPGDAEFLARVKAGENPNKVEMDLAQRQNADGTTGVATRYGVHSSQPDTPAASGVTASQPKRPWGVTGASFSSGPTINS